MRVPSQWRAVVAIGVVTVAAIAFFLTWGVDGHWDFALPRRSEQLAALAVVGVAIAVSTVVFQTLTHNRILTPSIMGFDALYVLLATALIFFLGSAVVDTWSPLATFVVFAGTTVAVATVLYSWIIGSGQRGLYTLLLVGVIMATLFGSITAYLFRVMNPNEYENLLTTLFATVNDIDTEVLGIGAVFLVAGIAVVYALAPLLDVLALGRDQSISLGVNHRRAVFALLMLITLLIAVATAVVGPITFLGLLVANLAYQLTKSSRHLVTLTAASLLSIAALVLGQAILQHVFNFGTTLSVIINLVGGVYFILLLLREARS